MSNRSRHGMAELTFEPVRKASPGVPGQGLFLLAFAYPFVVVLLELASRMCATSFFDPMPTWGHVVAVFFVPAANLLIWSHLQKANARCTRWLVFMSGAALVIGGFYALLFLPLLPLAVIALVAVIGLLPLAPFAAFFGTIRLLSALCDRRKEHSLGMPLLGGIAVGFALILLPDARGAATRLGIQWAVSDTPSQRERGLALLRSFGDDDLLLRLCYGMSGRQAGLVGALFAFDNNGFDFRPRRTVTLPSVDAREIYYRLHGEPFNTRPAPFDTASAIGAADFQFDNDHGGTQVGGRIRGLSMVASRLDGSVNGDDAVAYLEWTVEFRNTSWTDREARVQFALPPHGVVSRATLWVNGEEREAAYGGRGAVRAAYQRVAVQQRRDPLLVTTRGADRVLAQAFPVPRNGIIKFKLGITAPLDVAEPGKARLVLPSIVDRNFSFDGELRHNVWIESKRPLAVSDGPLAVGRDDGKPFRVSGAIGDNDLSTPRPVVTVERDPSAGRAVARIGENDAVVQTIARGAASPAGTLMLVIDGSARLAGTAPQLVEAFDAIPGGLKVGAFVATDPVQQVAPAPWSDAQKRNLVTLIRSVSYDGGQDNAPALADALTALEAERDATLLWIHGPQPVSFRGSAGRLEQAFTRLSRLPKVVLYSVEPGPNDLLPDTPWAWSAQTLPKTASAQADLARFFGGLSEQAQAFAVHRSTVATEGLSTGSDHIARLWANDHVLDLMRSNPEANHAAAVALAAKYQLVTPVSGAVVLESKQQYDESRLTPVEKGTVPTTPEPHEWALALIACAALLWLVWRHRRQTMLAA
jgi:hypothetical protein